MHITGQETISSFTQRIKYSQQIEGVWPRYSLMYYCIRQLILSFPFTENFCKAIFWNELPRWYWIQNERVFWLQKRRTTRMNLKTSTARPRVSADADPQKRRGSQKRHSIGVVTGGKFREQIHFIRWVIIERQRNEFFGMTPQVYWWHHH